MITIKLTGDEIKTVLNGLGTHIDTLKDMDPIRPVHIKTIKKIEALHKKLLPLVEKGVGIVREDGGYGERE